MKTTIKACPICGKPGPYGGDLFSACHHYDGWSEENKRIDTKDMEIDTALKLAEKYLENKKIELSKAQESIFFLREVQKKRQKNKLIQKGE